MMKQLIGQTLDRYRIISSLGEGGMGAVYKAHDITLQRDVAIKVMHSYLARQPDFQERFLQEARTIARLDYPNIVQIFDFGEAHELLYLVMEFIPGDNMRQMLHDLRAGNKWIALPEAIRLIHQVSLALDYAHHQKVLHRDIKPDNIMLKDTPSDGLSYRPMLTDLGLAKLLEDGHRTKGGIAVGTPAYMSPEQAVGRRTDARSDVYSLGVLLYKLVVGQLPFPINTLSEAIRYHVKEAPPAPRSIHPDLPTSVERVVLKALEKNPAKRFPRANVLAEVLIETLPAASEAPTPASAVSLMTQYQQSLIKARGSSIWVEFPSIPTDLSQDRISILAPEGTINSVPLPTRGLTIGREANNALVLNYPNVSQQHARVEFDGTNYRVSDLGSTNGTYLGNAKLLPGVPKVWTRDKALRIGESWLRLERGPSSARSAFIPSTGTLIDPTRIDSSPGLGWVGVYVEAFQLAITPGSEATVPVIVLNQGPETDRFEVSVVGEAAHWVSISPAVVQLPSGIEREVKLTIQPPRSPQSRAGRHRLKIRVVSQNDPSQVAEVSRTLTIAAYSQFKSSLQSQRIDAEQPTHIKVENQGNAPEPFNLRWQNQAQDLIFTTPQKRLQVPAGQVATAEFQAAPRQYRWIGGTKVHLFSIQVSSSAGETQTHEGEVVSTGLLPIWLLPVFLFLCVALAAAPFVYNWIISSPPEVAVVDTSATATAQAATATATWLGQDDDQDGLTNGRELELNTLPNKRDTDEDGLDDGNEVSRGIDPLNRDTDRDGTPDANDPDPDRTPTPTSIPPTNTLVPPTPTPIPPTNTSVPPTPTPIPPTVTPTNTPTPPQCVPLLISPTKGAILDNGRTDRSDDIVWDFDWSNCPVAPQYHLYVHHTGAQYPVIDDSTISNSSYRHVCRSCYIIDQNRFSWTWKVRAKVNGQWGEWSEIWTFDVEPVNSDPSTHPPTNTPTPTLSIESFVGTWRNVDPNTRSWTKIEITKDGNLLFAHFWGACTPSDCDAGVASAVYEGSPVQMYIDSGFATRDHTISLEGNTLHVTTFTHFTDNSGRADYTSEGYFRK